MPNEKVYVLLYTKKQPEEAHDEVQAIPVDPPPSKFAKLMPTSGPRDLDIDESDENQKDSDSDVIVQQDANAADALGNVDSTQGSHRVPEPSKPRNQGLLNYTLEEQHEIMRILRSSDSFKEALTTLTRSLPKLEVYDRSSAT